MAPDEPLPGPAPAPDPEGGRPRAPDPWWKIRLFNGMVNDLRRRLPYYASDWLDAWDYRVVPATVYMYFAKYVATRDVPCFFSCSSSSCRRGVGGRCGAALPRPSTYTRVEPPIASPALGTHGRYLTQHPIILAPV